MCSDIAIKKILTAMGQDLPDEHWIEALKKGTHVLIRPLHQQDRQREFLFIKHLSPDSRRARFLGAVSEEDTSLLNQMMDVDNRNRMAYVAMVHDNGELTEVGISRYTAAAGDRQCECAVAVADDWQRQGMGTLLMKHLIAAAQRNGFKKMLSIDQASNYGMHRLAKNMGFESRYAADDFTEIIHELDLT